MPSIWNESRYTAKAKKKKIKFFLYKTIKTKMKSIIDLTLKIRLN